MTENPWVKDTGVKPDLPDSTHIEIRQIGESVVVDSTIGGTNWDFDPHRFEWRVLQ